MVPVDAVTPTRISDEMRSIVGVVMSRATSFPISASDIRKWAIAVYFPEVPPPLFWDEEYAAGTHFGGIVAPEEFNPFAWMSKEPRAQPRDAEAGAYELELGVQPPPYKAVLQGEIRASYGPVRMRPGDVIRSTRKITEYHEREGRMGLQLYTTIAIDYVNQRDEWIKTLETVYVRY
jgi:hypothetical protein